MSPISKLQQVAALIRQQVAARPAASAARPAPAARRNAPQRGAAAQARRRIAALDPSDPERGRKAFRHFLEAVLLQQFGAQLANDAAFQELTCTLQQRMEHDPELAPLVQQAIALLLTGGR
ncbi:MAG: hypothetical protein K0R43_410 [Pseudoduganella sp.]|jgi:hypothetical protein|nr:hypothetical protein [Pseudoduganella sp.]